MQILHLDSRCPLNFAALIGRLLSSMLKMKIYPAKKGDAFLINANGNARTAGPAKPEKWTGEGVAIAYGRS